jgi:hypothetical protein
MDDHKALVARPTCKDNLQVDVGTCPACGALPCDWVRHPITDKDSALREAADALEAAQAEIERLREALGGLIGCFEQSEVRSGHCCCGDDMENHANPMDCGHSPVDSGMYYADLAVTAARALLGDTHDPD